MQCRACLKTNCENSTLLNELKIKCFNLITDLNINQDDSMPQQLCENCAKGLEFCVEFRDKCIASNSILVSALTKNEDLNNITEIKPEVNLKYNEFIELETDSKEEIRVKNEYKDLEYNEMLQCEDNFVYEYISDVKQPNIDEISATTSASSKDKTNKLLSNNTRTRALRAVKKQIITHDNKQPEDTKYDCGLCNEKIVKSELCDHVKLHESNKYCSICSFYFIDSEAMLYHRISHLQNPNIICHICLRTCQTSVTLEYHYNIKHFGKIEDAAKCRVCNKNYVNLKNFKKHMLSMHYDTNKTFECSECSGIFRNKNALRYHKLKVHVMDKRIWFCDNCDYKTKFNAMLRRHQLRKHTPNKVSCKLCKALFKDENRLKQHRCKYSTHSVCPVCGIVIEVPKTMTEHLAKHSDECKYKCDRCDAAYKTKCALKVHKSKHDGVRGHKCEYCPRAFWGASTLIKHRRVHTGEKPYVCKVCNKGFTANHNLKLHMRVHGVYNLIKKKGAQEDSTESVQKCD